MPSNKPVVLHLGDPVKFNTDLYTQLQEKFTVIRPSVEERQREPFLQALRDRKWGDIAGVMKPFWGTGGEMGRWDKELIPLLPESFKVYAAAGAGFDWADVDIMAARGILYCNGASASSEAVADMALYHIISVFRNMQWSNMAARSGNAETFLHAHHNTQAEAHNPAGQTLGIVGLGNIGYTIAKKTHAAFGMKIVYYDPFPKSAEQEAAVGATRCSTLDEMLGQADCVVLAAPGQGGKKIIDREAFTKMKKGSRLVNVARGTLVDEDALVEALESRHLFAVGLDVYEKEPTPRPKLLENRYATLTCHTAGGAMETMMGFEELSMRNVMAVLSGEQPLTPVNKHMMK
ncbi:uncharacterized protein B0I36DRAFT_245155 [Microdochium trichocladiopsis]|uniref:D-mandelate dehydrogenase n=1 Tax=Microdochium trichocladiopsis TaxID=1682393 RepID=A0A9P8Y824_9PEZI|nr:uncharacterized protein B0I36DRAFT_245155 [Microdochium trichocladiopsis]KAH7029886.1 hypothetical protein B0I36DRAFT_245155 [Microdochium trichocladiopsis]